MHDNLVSISTHYVITCTWTYSSIIEVENGLISLRYLNFISKLVPSVVALMWD